MGLIEEAVKVAEHTSSPLDGMPVWTKIAGYLGFPIVVAGVLLFTFTTQIKQDRDLLRDNNEMIRQHNALSFQAYLNKAIVDAAVLRTLSQICANGAQTPAERKECAVAVIPQPPFEHIDKLAKIP